MILIADGGSTKVDWVAIDKNKNEVFRAQTLGLNPNVVSDEELHHRIANTEALQTHKESIDQVYFYGAGCGTEKPKMALHNILSAYFNQAKEIMVEEDMLAAVYASAKNKEAIVCILGTGANSCYSDGKDIYSIAPPLGYTIMDEASGNYYGKRLVRDYFYKKMPEDIRRAFAAEFDLTPDIIKHNLYKADNPNRYLASFAKFMFDHQDNAYIKKLVKNGFKKFFNFHILNYKKAPSVPIYFIGSIAFYFSNILKEVADDKGLVIAEIIRKPIDNLIDYHKNIS